MSDTPAPVSQTVLELRQAFDEPFASPPPAVGAAADPFLAIGLGGDPYALRLADVAGLFKDRRLTLLPGRPHFLGIAAVQGRPIPVYDLPRLLGYAPTGIPRWLVLVLAPDPLGLAFDSFEGQFAVASQALAAAPAGRTRHVSQLVRAGDIVRRLVVVPSVVEAIRSEAGLGQPAQER